jgi:hypothetical protein
MKNYSDLQDIDTCLKLSIKLRPINRPNIWVRVNRDLIGYTALSDSIQLDYQIGLLDNINIVIELYNKDYNNIDETAIIIDNIMIDNIDIVPKYDYLADYVNDHDFKNPTNYLGFNGKWTLTIDRPFYHWLHEHSGQGWLIG